MRRRALLASIAVGSTSLAGCAFLGGTDEPTTTEPADGTTTEQPGSPEADSNTGDPDRPELPDELTSVIDLETGPRTYSLVPTRFRTDDEAAVTLWFDRTATADHPARIRGYLENANPFANTFRIDRIPLVGRTYLGQPPGYDYEASLQAAPTENNDLATEVPEPRHGDDGFWHVADAGQWMAETRRLEPGEGVELEYDLVGLRGSPGRPTGTYEARGDGRAVAIHVWDADEPGPTGESRFAGRSVPAFEGDTTTGWYHEADRSTPAYVVPSSERVELDGVVDFEVVNHSDEAVRCGHWDLHKLVDGAWFHVGPKLHTSDCRGLAPGESMEWSLRAFDGEAVPCGSCSDAGGGCRGGLTHGYLGGGEYAVVAGYGSPADESAALVELVGDPVEVVPTEDASVERDGDVAVVTTDRFGDGEHPEDGTFTLTRATTADERIIPEQVMAPTGSRPSALSLRDALAAMTDDVERVVVRTDEHGVDGAIGYDADVRRFRIRGQAYEVRRGEYEG